MLSVFSRVSRNRSRSMLHDSPESHLVQRATQHTTGALTGGDCIYFAVRITDSAAATALCIAASDTCLLRPGAPTSPRDMLRQFLVVFLCFPGARPQPQSGQLGRPPLWRA